MGAFSFRFLAICFTCLALTISVANAGSTPPTVTVNPPSGGGSSGGSSVCDPAIRSMLDAAGSAQAQRDISTIGSVIQRPPNAMEINCYDKTRDQLTGETGGTGGTGGGTPPPSSSSKAPCSAMDDAWKEQIDNANNAAKNAAGTPTASATFDRINLYAGATDPISQVASNECHPGIPTGVKINGAAEIVCPNPGCAPKKDGDSYKCEKY